VVAFDSQSTPLSQANDFNVQKKIDVAEERYDEQFQPFFVLICILSLNK
jgi:hypothetical protein